MEGPIESGSVGLPTDPPVDAIFDTFAEADSIEFELRGGMGALRTATEVLFRDLWQCLLDSVAVWDDCTRTIAYGILADLRRYEALYALIGNQLEASILGEIGFTNGLAPDAPFPEITDAELTTRAQTVPLSIPGLPPLSEPPAGLGYLPPPPSVDRPLPGTPFTIPDFPQLPPVVMAYPAFQPIGPPPVGVLPYAPAPQPPAVPSLPGQSGPGTGQGSPGLPHPATVSQSGSPASGTHPLVGPGVPASVPMPPPGTTPYEGGVRPYVTTTTTATGPTLPGVPVQVLPGRPSPIQTPANTGQPTGVASGSGIGPGNGTDVADTPCPPVHVHIHCPPGGQPTVTGPAIVVQSDDGGSDNGMSQTQFVSFGSEVDDGSVKPARTRSGQTPGFDPDRRKSLDDILAEWQKVNLCADHGIEDWANIAWRALKKLEPLLAESEGATFDATRKRILADVPDWAKPVVEPLLDAVLGILRTAYGVVGGVTGCEPERIGLLMLLRAGLDALERWGGPRLPEIRTRLDQVSGILCAQGMPGPGEADQAFLMEEIDYPQWKCWVRAAGLNHEDRYQYLESQYTRPSPMQVAQASRYLLHTREEFGQYLRHVGVRYERDAGDFWRLTAYVPPISDLITFMTRDVFDDNVVRKYGYDSEFPDKWVGKAREWGQMQGIDPEVALYYWRAHWHLPSTTQAFEMLHRLRPDRVKADVVVTGDTVKELLAINDVPKYWRERLMEVSYLPLTRVDIRRAYFQGALTEDETYQQIRDRGYNDRDANLLLNYWRLERRQWLKNRREYREFVSGFTPVDTFNRQLSDLGFTSADILVIESEATKDQTLRSVQSGAKAIRSRVLRGLLSWTDATPALSALGFGGQQAAQMTRDWEREREARGKHASIAMLCDWWGRAWIDDEEYANALARIGYSPGQIALIFRACREKSKATAEKQEKAEKAAKAATVKREQSEAQKAATAANRLKGQAARAEQIKRAMTERVQRRLAGAAADLARKLGRTGDDYVPGVRAWYLTLTDEMGQTPDGASLTIANVIVDAAVRHGDSWQEEGARMIALLPRIAAAGQKAD